MKKQISVVFIAACACTVTVATAAFPTKEEIRANRQAAEQRFRQHQAEPKQVGMTVCNPDNRLGYIEQIAGGRIKVEVRAMAAGVAGLRRNIGPEGPFEYDTSMMSMDEEEGRRSRREPLPVKDPYYLWQGQKTIQTLPLLQPRTVWEAATDWAPCSWNISG